VENFGKTKNKENEKLKFKKWRGDVGNERNLAEIFLHQGTTHHFLILQLTIQLNRFSFH